MYLTLGLQHIADFKGYDHILFIITLVAVYVIQDWKKILILITAFTIGHSLTLVLATFNILKISGEWIEFLIPVTIVLTALGNIFQRKEQFSKKHHLYKYLLALFFGLIHGLGFSATGGPLSFEDNQAVFRQVLSVPGMAKGTFNWQPDCSHVRLQPYLVIIKAKDKNAELELIDSKNLEIFVHSPAPEMLDPTPGSASIKINWDACSCQNNSGYNIYRKSGNGYFDQGPCDVGVPDEAGYKLIATVEGSDIHEYIDNNNGSGLQQSTLYCYRVSAVFEDGAESFASTEVCSELVQGSPMIIQVSVEETDTHSGQIRLAWLEPGAEVLNGLTGPFRYRIYRSKGMYAQTPVMIDSLDGLSNTVFIDKNINTQDSQWSDLLWYRVKPFPLPNCFSNKLCTIQHHAHMNR